MKRTFVLLFAMTAFLALPLQAQEKEMPKEKMMSASAIKPLEDDLCKWMIGEWEGWSESTMGKAQETMKVEWGLDKQFVMTSLTSKVTEMKPEQMKAMAEAMKMSKEDMSKMMERVYKGMGPMTINPMTGEWIAFWFDNWRGMYKGTGKREGNKIVMNWEGPMGKSVRTIEKAGEDKLVMTYKEEMPGGVIVEGRTEMTRKRVAKK